MSHPYSEMPPRAFWRTAIAEADRDLLPDLYQPRVAITQSTRVVTAGSCFAQHIGNYLSLAGCNVLDAEPAPRDMSEDVARHFHYGIYSARYGNVYTARQLRQLLEDVVSDTVSPQYVWPHGKTFVDALRPTVEPHGLETVEEVLLHRRTHLAKIRAMLPQTDVFVFTLGLTESWQDVSTGRVFPVCPGVSGGTYHPEKHGFHNFTQSEVLADLHSVHALLKRFNPDIQMLLTVSPVPLTATATSDHVLPATTYSKAVLRAAAGEFLATTTGTDYFPSLEIITAPASGGPWFTQDMRSVTTEGVEKVMSIFFAAQGLIESAPPTASAQPSDDGEDTLVCEELLLQAFAK